ncbi:MAG: alpha/beta hydrolase [Rhodocyclales bacterium]|nr:alpha/beta hydrolase [Rhodocyclales bacterium]
MKQRITLVHGWGYDATLWREVVPLLAGLDVEVADLGFFGAPALPADCDQPRIAVGHSLGALWWLAQTDLPWTRLVAINGFPRFTAAADFPQGVAPRILERMSKRFLTAPAAVLADFQAACGAAGPALPDDPAPLRQGLAALAEVDARTALVTRRQDVFALAAREDAIVPAAMSEAAYAGLPTGHLRWVEDGGHLLPLTHARACAALIREVAGS